MQIEFDVDGQRLIRTSDAYIIEGSEFFVECLFSFSSDWDELDKWAIFKRGNDTYETFIVGNRCIVPVECTAVEGEFTISLIGRRSSMLIIATTSEKLLYVRATSHSNMSYFDKALAYIKDKAEQAASVLKSVLDAKEHIDKTDYKIYVGETAPTEDITNAMVWINPAEDDDYPENLQVITSGSTEERPTDYIVGMCYFDTTLGKPVWCKEAGVWVDANGTTV